MGFDADAVGPEASQWEFQLISRPKTASEFLDGFCS